MVNKLCGFWRDLPGKVALWSLTPDTVISDKRIWLLIFPEFARFIVAAGRAFIFQEVWPAIETRRFCSLYLFFPQPCWPVQRQQVYVR